MRLRLLISSAILFALSSSLQAQIKPELEEMTVYGIFNEPDRVTGSAYRVEQELLESFKYDDINRVLNFVPGVYSREEDGVGLRPNIGLRGGSADRSQKVTLMEDGVLISPAPYSAPAAYFFPHSSRMVGVEVYKGPSSIQYGPQTIGGAINLVSAPIPESTEMLAEFGGGSNGYQHMHLRAGTSAGKTGILGEAVHMSSDGFKELDNGGETGFDKNELLVKASHVIGPGKLEMRLGYADEVSDETYLGLTEADIRATPYRRYTASSLDRMEWDWLGARINWSQPILGGQFRVLGYTQKLDRAWKKFNNFSGADIRELLENPEGPFNQLFINILQGDDSDGVGGSPDDIRIGTNDRAFESSGLQGVMNWEFGTTVEHKIELGMRYHHDQIRRLHDEYGFEQLGGELVQNNQPRAITTSNFAETDALAIWARDEIVLGSWTYVPGVRLENISNSFNNYLSDRSNDNRYSVVLPGIGARYEFNDDLSVLAGVHKGFSPAAPSDSFDLEPEESINYEFGGRWQGELGRLELIGFFNDYSNLTAICTFSSGCASGDLDTQTNAGEVHATGLEASWNHIFNLAAGLSLPVAFTYTYTDAVFQESFSSTDPQFGDVEEGYEMPYIPPHRANLNVGIESENWSVVMSASYVARMRNQAGIGSFDKSEGSDAYTTVDLAAHYDFSRRWRMSTRIDNVLDEEYVVSRRPFGARPAKPQSIVWELSYRY